MTINGNDPATILAVADFGASGTDSSSSIHPMDKSNINDILRHFSPSVAFKVPNRLGFGGSLDVNLQVQDLRDFHPTNVIANMPPLRDMVTACELLVGIARADAGLAQSSERIRGLTLPDDLRADMGRVLTTATVASPPPQQSPARGENPLAGVAMPGVAAAPDTSPTSRLLESLGIPRQKVAGNAAREAAAGLLEKTLPRLHNQLDAILHHPDFRALESAWRGLHFLVTRACDADGWVRVVMAECRRPQLPARLEDIVIQAARAVQSDGVAACVADFAFGPAHEDVVLLRALSEAASRAYCPMLVEASADLLGVNDDDYTKLPLSLRQRFDAPDLVEWRALRREPSASYLGAVVPRILGRPPYGPKTSPVAETGYQEAEPHLWINGVWAVGAALGQSLARSGWSASFVGQRDGRIDDLPLTPIQTRHGRVHSCTQAVWSDDETTELARQGLTLLSARPQAQFACVMSAPSLFDPPPSSNALETHEQNRHASLPYGILANRVAQRIDAASNGLPPSAADADVIRDLTEAVRQLFTRGAGADVDVVISREDDGTRVVTVAVEPKFQLAGARPEVQLSFALRG